MGLVLPGPDVLLQAAGPWVLLVICGFVLAETGLLVGVALPGDTLLLLAGILTAAGVIRIPIAATWLAAAAAAVVGDQLGFLIGRRGGRALLVRLRRRRTTAAMVDSTDAFFSRFGRLAIVLARFVPIVRTIAPMSAGIFRMPYRRFVLVNVASAFVWCTVMVLGGYGVGFIPGAAVLVQTWIDPILIGCAAAAGLAAFLHLRRGKRPGPSSLPPQR